MSCAILQQFLYWVLHDVELNFITQVVLYWGVSSLSFYGIGLFSEYIIVTITDILPIFIFGYDITQLLAWTVIGNAYNLEGHSSLSIFFIASDFHDLHHTSFKGNYGIHGFWDRVFNTLNPPTKKSGIISPVASLEKKVVNLSSRGSKVMT
ncbi:sterol desaturase family protein [Coleofasciculus sp. F4-SAH-05]|uniref:sterol desaturase family protein n=1 Tax=Coleofasciculus sp. F4-SAH-05 TaxID=3069525 RepID=UPI003300267F